MITPSERLTEKAWIAPWLQHEHTTRYEWAATLAAGRKVADAACGTGYGSRRLLAGGALQVDGFDLSPEAIAEARRLHACPGIRFEVADVTCLPTPDCSYDLFVSFETIEHVRDDLALLREVKRVLKPDGTFLCSTPNRTVTNPGIPITGRPYNPFHVREYTQPELEAVLRQVFPSVTFLGQSFHGGSYVRALNRIGGLWRMLAVRLHQSRKVLGVPWEKPERHQPTHLADNREPEVMVAVCRLSDAA
jgi:ubiquinone/menaquinone biosynthesis C-methylase UbiE